MGQLIEWPEVVTEGKDIEACHVERCPPGNGFSLSSAKSGISVRK
jgi:hypothetical protein